MMEDEEGGVSTFPLRRFLNISFPSRFNRLSQVPEKLSAGLDISLCLKRLDKDFGAGAEQLEMGKVVNDVSIPGFTHDGTYPFPHASIDFLKYRKNYLQAWISLFLSPFLLLPLPHHPGLQIIFPVLEKVD
jgi:hypothetical protein